MKGKILFITIIIMIIMGCNSKIEYTKGYDFQSIKSISKEDLQKLSQLKIYFGHQSVGKNIIEGISEIINETSPGLLFIDESLNRLKSSEPVFAHTKIGKNTEPLEKIDDFANKIREIDGKADIAFLKLCYVDIRKTTDVVTIFNHYKNTLSTLKKTYPNITFIHFTNPLTSDETGIVTSIRRLLGKNIRGYEDNVARHHFNEMMRAEYMGKEPFFDIASIEATNKEGNQIKKKVDSKQYIAMIDEYTYDGGHLNEAGRKVVAEQLLVYILNLIK